MGKLVLYIADTETTGLDPTKNDIIEISLLRLSDGEQETWKIQPINFETIEMRALEVNKTTLDDLKDKSKYKPADIVLPEIENWVLEDDCSMFDRVLVGHNIQFDLNMMLGTWGKMGCSDSFPFPKWGNLIDTKGMALLYDFFNANNIDKYNLAGCVKRFGLQKRAFHGATEDVLATKDLFEHLCCEFKGGEK